MKSEREIAELIFDKFRKTNCKTDQTVPFGSIRFGLIDNLNPKEVELFNIVFVGLQALGYFTYEKNGLDCIRLTEKGYDYIYDDEKIAFIIQRSWVIPERENPNWDKAYNRLWRIIGPQESAIHYITGPQFYKLVFDLCDDIPPSYSDFIEQRGNKNLSTSRVRYYKDLIDKLSVEKRFQLYVSIQLAIEIDSKQTVAVAVKDEFNLWLSNTSTVYPVSLNEDNSQYIDASVLEKAETESPKVFISYSWDDPTHEEWVLNLATKLVNNGVDIILDRWDLGKFGKLIPEFMEQSISKSKRVICVMTPNYKKKTENLQGGVGYEYSIITSIIFGDVLNTSKFIPLVRNGTDAEVIPTALKGRNYINMRQDESFDIKLEELFRDIHDEPKYKKPAIGKKPKFD